MWCYPTLQLTSFLPSPLLFLIARGRIEVRTSQGHSILASSKSHARESPRVTTAKCELICNLHINRFADAATRRGVVGPSFVNVNGPPSLPHGFFQMRIEREGEGDVLYIMWLCAHQVDWNVDGDGRDDGHVNVQRSDAVEGRWFGSNLHACTWASI